MSINQRLVVRFDGFEKKDSDKSPDTVPACKSLGEPTPLGLAHPQLSTNPLNSAYRENTLSKRRSPRHPSFTEGDRDSADRNRSFTLCSANWIDQPHE